MKKLLVAAAALALLTFATASVPAVIVPRETKRAVAEKLIRAAERAKERSLRDVLSESADDGGARERLRESLRESRKGEERVPERRARHVGYAGGEGRAGKTGKASNAGNVGNAGNAGKAGKARGRRQGKERGTSGARSSSRGSARDGARRGAKRASARRGSASARRGSASGGGSAGVGRDGDTVLTSWTEMFGGNSSVELSVLTAFVNASTVVVRGDGDEREQKGIALLPRNALALRNAGSGPTIRFAMNDAEDLVLNEVEVGVVVRALGVLESSPIDNVEARVEALAILEELCHGQSEAIDLNAAGGLEVILGDLFAENEKVRASAALTLGVCSQNNPEVQRNLMSLGAVPVLMNLAAADVPQVCSRALLALNALVELNAARVLFEDVVSESGIDALRRPLIDQSDTRATRRALNLAHALVSRNLDSWKTYLEAWDLSPVIESLLYHSDADVRESAARLISALDSF